MYANAHLDLHASRSRELQRAAALHALGNPARRRLSQQRLGAVPEAVRLAVGFRLVEAGLRLVVGDGAHPPSSASSADMHLARQ